MNSFCAARLALIAVVLLATSPAALAGVPRAEESTACVSGACHRKLQRKLKQSAYVHEVAREGSCTTCHEPHANGKPGKLRRPLALVCQGCHDEPGASIAAARYVHDPIKRDQCEACHDPHGSPYVHLLKRFEVPADEARRPFTTGFMTLCWECHDSELATLETTVKTAFRDGKKNLHFVHLKKQKDFVRTCDACHDLHAAGQPGILRAEVALGARLKSPLVFTPKPKGGACAVGCHKVRGYEREP